MGIYNARGTAQILRIVEEQRRRESKTWRKMESRENKLKSNLLRKEKDKVHELLGRIDELEHEVKKVKEDNVASKVKHFTETTHQSV